MSTPPPPPQQAPQPMATPQPLAAAPPLLDQQVPQQVPAQAPAQPFAAGPAVGGYTSPIPVRRTHLGNAIASEWTKIRTVRSSVWTLVIMFATTVGLALLVNAGVKAADESLMPPPVPGFVGILFGHIAIITFGVLVMSTEYTTGMIRTTLTASPQRGRLLLAKGLVFSLVAFVATAAALALALVLSLAIQGDTTARQEMPGSVWLSAVLGLALYVTLLGLLSVAMAGLLRSSAGAITLMLGLVLVPTIGGTFLYISENLHDFANTVQEYAAIGAMSALATGYDSPDVGSGWPPLLLLAGVTAAALLGAYARLTSSDA